jgi:hypothetical protein
MNNRLQTSLTLFSGLSREKIRTTVKSSKGSDKKK